MESALGLEFPALSGIATADLSLLPRPPYNTKASDWPRQLNLSLGSSWCIKSLGCNCSVTLTLYNDAKGSKP